MTTATATANPTKALWEKGDFTRIAATMRESGEALVRRIGISRAVNIFDLGCGDGTTAVPAAKLGAYVAGVDIATNLVEAGNARAEEEGVPNCDPTLVAQILKISSAYTPPPPEGFVSPMTWGIEDHVRQRFAAAGIAPERISFEQDTFAFNYPGTPSGFVAQFRNYYGPTMNVFEAAEKNDRAGYLQKELEELFQRQNQSGDKTKTSIPATFLRVTVAV